MKPCLLDDALLIEELLTGLPRGLRPGPLATTSTWYFRACRAVVAGAGGHLSGPFEQVDIEHQRRAIRKLLELPHSIDLVEPRAVVPAMAQLASRYPRLNLLNLDAVASVQLLDAVVWLSPPAVRGVLPAVLDAEGIRWREVPSRLTPD